MWYLYVTVWLYASASASNAQWFFSENQIRGPYKWIAECHAAELSAHDRRTPGMKIETRCTRHKPE